MSEAVSASTQLQSIISSITPRPLQGGRDFDGDNDNSRPGEVETSEPKSPPASQSSTLGTRIDTTA